jgi:alanine-glyoxylate transaminase / serine-glyoxylate transaminase / serine-pyruvate transaminase
MPNVVTRNATRKAGRHFLQIPGPSPVPDRIVQACMMPVLDHRGPEFQKLGHRVLDGMKGIFQTKSPVVIYPASGTGAWEAALVNTLSPGDHILMYESGHFASLWKALATKLGFKAEIIASDWRHGVDANAIESRLRQDTEKSIKAVCIVHNETSTGATSRVEDVRHALDAVQHPALLMVDTISGLGSAEYKHDAWGVDVGISGSQKGLMLPPGLSFNALSDKALAASKTSQTPKLFWSWEEMLPHNRNGFFHYTPATTLLYGLAEAIDMMNEEGLSQVFARHQRHAEATRRAVAAWGFENVCLNERHFSPVLTTVLLPVGYDADRYRRLVLENFDMSLGTGLSKLAGKAFRIGHLGDINDLTLLGALSGCEMGFELAGIPHSKGGLAAAMAHLSATAPARLS